MKKVTHKLEFLVNASEPIPEINNVIFEFLHIHPGKETQILTELQTEITAAIKHYTTEVDSE
ncbi:hypothetical protein D3P07_00880 [Paenibacillus sp. 1011MAR3C5]|uniref:hypothetical protein n=1 Tax=Paenibacillus sp. 1011MAR3C5 TaxID=1675787 RepID=UPI000E6CA70F|nr:hypothetical protein [Paenibacillus sp. 1011MAR3C5]RJE90693.1 hypothetical protein D3P07_00880 [Paenibacillus sp. 1011MAR3C5]